MFLIFILPILLKKMKEKLKENFHAAKFWSYTSVTEQSPSLFAF